MPKKKNLIFICLLILGVFLITGCLPKPPVTKGILTGQVIVPEGSKQLTGQALADATVNIIDPATGDIIATTITDANGYYQVFVPAGGPYLLEAVKDGVKLLQITPQVEVGIEYALGTADCSTTAVALIALAMMDAEDYPDDLADINLSDIEADSDFNDVMSTVCSAIEAGGDPAESAVIQQAIEDFLYPPAPSPPPPPPPTTYTVTFDSQGGSAVNSQTVEHGGKATEPTAPTKTGYTFGGWYKESGCTNPWVFATDTVTADVTLYAKWTINTYTVTFDKNDDGAAGTMADQTIASGSSANLTACGFTKTGWTFSGWATTPGGDVEYADQASYTMGTANVTLYAKWTINTYTVIYNNNDSTGGSVSTDTSNPYEYGATVTVLNNTGNLVKTGYTFTGWNTQADGNGTDQAEGSTFTMGASNVTLYAKWTINTYTVTYNGNGHTGGTVPADPSSPYEYGATVTVLNNTGNLVKTGYTFTGWNTQADGNGTDQAEGSTFTMGASNVTLYAKWTINTYTVTYNGNGHTGGTVPADLSSPYEYGATVTVLSKGDLVKTQDGISLLFTGWNTADDGSGTSYNEADTFNMGSANVTLYAQWSVLRSTGPAGGLIFYDDEADSIDDIVGARYLEAAPQ